MDNQSLTQKENSFLTPPIRMFLEMCLWEKGIRDSDESVKEDMIQDLAPRLQDWLWQAIFPRLNEADLPEWKELMAREASQAEVISFFKSKLPDFDNFMEQAMKEFKDIYVKA